MEYYILCDQKGQHYAFCIDISFSLSRLGTFMQLYAGLHTFRYLFQSFCLPQHCSGDIEMRCVHPSVRPSFCLSRLVVQAITQQPLMIEGPYLMCDIIMTCNCAWASYFADSTFDLDPVTFRANFLSGQYLRNYK